MRTTVLGLAIILVGCGSDSLKSVPNPPQPPTDEPPANVVPPATCQTGALTGRVCVPGNDQGLAGATVQLTATDCNGQTDTYQATTDEHGSFSLTGLPEGTHTVQVVQGSTHLIFGATIRGGQITVAQSDDPSAPLCRASAPPRVAVIAGEWDEVQVLLEDLSIPYQVFQSTASSFGGQSPALRLLSDLSAMRAFDVIFFNCGDFVARDYAAADVDWLTGDVTFDFTTVVYENLRTFVQQGGSLYASDWAWNFVEGVRPTAIDFYGDETMGYNVVVGAAGEFEAEVTNAELEGFLGSDSLHVSMDLDNWAVIESVGPGTVTYVRGPVTLWDGYFDTVTIGTRPLLVGFRPFTGGGLVLYTTFHYHSQGESEMLDVLRYLILDL